MTDNKIANKVVEVLESKKGIDVNAIKVDKVTILADYFIICSGTSSTHVKGMADEVEFRLKEEFDISYSHIEGYDTARWILMDYGDVIVHIFHEEEREFYNIERLWQDGIYKYRSSEQ